MKRIVFCTELGGNYGHVSGLLELSRNLCGQEDELIFVLCNMAVAPLLGEDVSCVQVPLPNVVPADKDSYSYAGLLGLLGYDDESVLTDYLTRWRNLLAGADLVIADHAPSALLAAQSLGIDCAAVGTGFVIPPPDMPLFNPGLAPDKDPAPHILATINRVMDRLSAPRLEKLGDIFTRSRQFLCTFPELDHYGLRAGTDYWGPLYSEHMGEIFTWPVASEANIFAYLTPRVHNLPAALAALGELPGFKLAHIPGIDPALAAAYNRSDLLIKPEPINMASVLPQVDLMISQGGAGVTSLCAIYGLRHVMVPTQMEQRMLTRRLVKQGLAYGVDPDTDAPDYAGIFNRALNCPTLTRNTELLRMQYRDFSQVEQLEALVEALLGT